MWWSCPERKQKETVMGLSMTHGCWESSYGGFMSWRVVLHACLTGRAANRESLREAWADRYYHNHETRFGPNQWWLPEFTEAETEALKRLMTHSDCDGEIDVADCTPLADALEKLLPIMDTHNQGERYADWTRRFVRGLREAASVNEPVEFL